MSDFNSITASGLGLVKGIVGRLQQRITDGFGCQRVCRTADAHRDDAVEITRMRKLAPLDRTANLFGD